MNCSIKSYIINYRLRITKGNTVYQAGWVNTDVGRADEVCRKEYLERINRVLEYIEDNLDSKLSLNVLAGVAGFSPYHFHRIFHSIVGQTLQDYVKDLRLTMAARRILHNRELSIAWIALECGFSTHSDFARSFKAKFGMSAKRFAGAKKAGDSDDSVFRKIVGLSQSDEAGFKYDENIKTIKLPDYNGAYIRNVGLSKNRKSPGIEKSFKKLFKWANAHGYISKETVVMGVMLDIPEVTPLEKCRFDACITVPENVCADGEIGIRRINSKGSYVTYYFENMGPDFHKVFFETTLYIYGRWIPHNGYMPDNKPFLEIYHIEPKSNKISMDFCIPVKPL